MDEQRFDAALRALQAGTTRRGGLAAALGMLLGGRALAAEGKEKGNDKGSGKRGAGAEGPCGDGTRSSNVCTKNSECCTGLCDLAPAKRNGDRKGRCRCIRRGEACSADRNCCGMLRCASGVCAAEGGGGGGGGGTCSAATCLTGCCKNGACNAGVSDRACGRGGAACAVCGGNTTCKSQRCQGSGGTCSAKTCPDGCCKGGVCKPGKSGQACGTGGDACVVCGSSKPVCEAGSCAAGVWSNETTFGQRSSNPEGFSGPVGIAVSQDGLTAWVCDLSRRQVSVWTRPNAGSTAWTYLARFVQASGPNGLKTPLGLSVTADQLTVLVAEEGSNQVSVWTRPNASSTAWSLSTSFGTRGTGDANMIEPSDVFVSADGLTAWITDSGNNRIVIWTRPDAASTAWSFDAKFGSKGAGDNNLSFPLRLVVSKDGLTAWISDNSNHRVVIWTRPNAGSTVWSYNAQFGTKGIGDDNFAYPTGIAVSADTLTVQVADRDLGRVVVWTRPNATSTKWSYLDQFGSPGSGAGELNKPLGLAASADMLTAWVADTNNSRISIWTQS